MIILPLESPSTQTISLKTKLKRMLSIYCLLMLPFDKFYLWRLSVTMDFVIYNDNMVNYESSQFVTSCKWFGGLNTFLSFALPGKTCSCFFLGFPLLIMEIVGKRRELWAHILREAASVLTFASGPKPPGGLLDLGFSPAQSLLVALILLSFSASCRFSSYAAAPADSRGATTPGSKLP